MTKKKRGDGDGSIYQRESDGLWVAAISVTDPETGRKKRKTFSGKKRNVVADKLKIALAEQQRGIDIAPKRQTVKQFLEKWLEDTRPRVRETTYQKYELHVRVRLAPTIGKHILSTLTPQQIQAMITTLNDGSVSPGTVADAHTVLITALNQAVRWSLVNRNVAMLVDKPRQPKKELSTLTPADARKFLEAVAGDRLEALFLVSLSLGLRRGEALGLKWEDIDLDRAILTVRRALQRLGGRLELVEPKSRSAYRGINLPSLTVQTLHKHRARQLEEKSRAADTWEETGMVFTTMQGKPIDPRNYHRSFDRALHDAGLDHIRLHDLRHTAASLLLAQGVPIKMISEILGHSRVGITLDTYSHLYEPTRQEAANKMDQILRPAPENSQKEGV